MLAVRVFAVPVERISDGRRFYLIELGGSPDAPAHVSLVDRDAEYLCDSCGEEIAAGSNVIAIKDVGMFHPPCAPTAEDLGDA